MVKPEMECTTQTFDAGNFDGTIGGLVDNDAKLRSSVYDLAAVTHNLLKARDYPDKLHLTSTAEQYLHSRCNAPPQVNPVCTISRSPLGFFAVEACLPSMRSERIINAIEYRLRLPDEDQLTAGLSIQALSRLVYHLRIGGREPAGLGRLLQATPGSVVYSLTGTLRALSDYSSWALGPERRLA